VPSIREPNKGWRGNFEAVSDQGKAEHKRPLPIGPLPTTSRVVAPITKGPLPRPLALRRGLRLARLTD